MSLPETVVHPSSIVDPEVQLGQGVVIGPNCQVVGQTQIGDGCVLQANVRIGSEFGRVTIGEKNRFHSFSFIGGPPQDITYTNQPTELIVGDENTFREFGSVNIATSKEDGRTLVGSHNYFMAYTHVGHDCRVGDFVVIANSSNLGGHVQIADHVKIGGVCSFNQFVRVGKHAFIGGGSVITKDILPFSSAEGHPCLSRATNKIGLERGGFSSDEADRIHRCLRRLLKGNQTQAEILSTCEADHSDCAQVMYLVDFIKNSRRGIAK